MDAQGLGLTVEHYQRDDEDVWPELWPMFEVMFEVGSSWRCGPSGPLCWDRVVVFEVLRHRGIDGPERDELLRWLAVAEAATLSQLAKA